MSNKQLQFTAWGLSLVPLVLAVITWGNGFQWQFENFSTYQLFPLFGLLAFSLMWSHYMASMLRKMSKADSTALGTYFETTSSAVLAAILLHPGLLLWQLWRDGFGLPPGSTKLYVGSALYIWTWVGLTAWLLFMAYELRRWYSKRPWWKYVQYMSDLAMFLILLHALQLGSNLQDGWFRGVWYFYGVTLAVSLVYNYWPKAKTAT
jgi:hypothetical protein